MAATLELLSDELETYESHLPELLGTAEGKWVLIHDSEIVGTYDTEADAINHGYRTLGNVPFLVRQVRAIELPQFVSHVAL